jgi:hypothetical protein
LSREHRPRRASANMLRTYHRDFENEASALSSLIPQFKIVLVSALPTHPPPIAKVCAAFVRVSPKPFDAVRSRANLQELLCDDEAGSADVIFHHLSSCGYTRTYGVICRSSVRRIMCTDGAYRPFRHDRHLSKASSFQIGLMRGRLIASSGMLALVSHRWHFASSQPYPPLRHRAMVGDGCAGPP